MVTCPPTGPPPHVPMPVGIPPPGLSPLVPIPAGMPPGTLTLVPIAAGISCSVSYLSRPVGEVCTTSPGSNFSSTFVNFFCSFFVNILASTGSSYSTSPPSFCTNTSSIPASPAASLAVTAAFASSCSDFL